MARYRIIPTSLTEPQDIQRALVEMGLREVEVFDTAQPLHDWIGRPTDVLANVIVRRKSIGSSSDDLGFVRNVDGTFDALISDIHLFRFDRKWLQDLARRCGVASPPASFETTAYVPQRKTPAPPLPPEHKNPGQALKTPPPIKPPMRVNLSSAATATPLGTGHAQRTQLDTTAIVERAHKSVGSGAVSCLLFALPIPVWIFISTANSGQFEIGILIPLMIVWTFIVTIVLSIRAASRLRMHVHEFSRRFPEEARDRATAIAHLEAMAAVKKSPMATSAARLLQEIKKRAASRPTPSRGQAGRG